MYNLLREYKTLDEVNEEWKKLEDLKKHLVAEARRLL